ncbi:MAG TPA: hypothetical protein VHS78_16670 [Candidatus Elarobacter sp.]|jgi:hypothetical protein|nr:hypothetical protein [Candidatus Elarobacter sp.]
MPNIIAISNVTLKNFGADASSDPKRDGTIDQYDGSTLYCHINPDTNDKTMVVIEFNQNPPNEFNFPGVGTIKSVAVNVIINEVNHPIKWTSGLPTGQYSGKKLMPYLSFAGDMKSAALVLDNDNEIPQVLLQRARAKSKPKSTQDDPNNIPTLGLIIVGPDLTTHEPRGYFVSVPLAKIAENPNFRDITLARVKWPKLDSVSGPIGSVNVP